MESAASGIVAAKRLVLPQTTMIGALCGYITDESVVDFQPMGANMGLLPSLSENIRDKQLKYEKLAERALTALKEAIA